MANKLIEAIERQRSNAASTSNNPIIRTLENSGVKPVQQSSVGQLQGQIHSVKLDEPSLAPKQPATTPKTSYLSQTMKGIGGFLTPVLEGGFLTIGDSSKLAPLSENILQQRAERDYLSSLGYGNYTRDEYTKLQQKQRDDAQKNLDALYNKSMDFWTAEDYANQKTYKQQIEQYTKAYNDALSGAAFLDDTQKARVAQLEKEQEALLDEKKKLITEYTVALDPISRDRVKAKQDENQKQLDAIRAELDGLDPSKKNYIMPERVLGTAKGSSRQWAGSQVAALGTAVAGGNALQDASSEEDRQIADSMYAGWVTDDLSRQNFLDAGVQGDGVLAENKRVEASLQKRADEMLERSNKELEDAKRNLGRGGQVALDVLAQGIQMGLDAATRAGSVSMWTRSFGSASQEARLQGAGIGQQFIYGAAVATVETLTEKIADGAAGIYGKGSADILADDIIFKLASTPRGQTALRFIYRAVSEGGEEVLSGLMEPVLKAIYDGGEAFKNAHMTAVGKQEYLSELGYSAFIGAILGGAGGSVSLATGQDAMSNVSAQARAEIRQMISSDNINEAKATFIASNPIWSEAFEEVTGITLAVDRTAETNLAGNTIKGKDGKAVPSDQKAILETRVKQIMSAKPQASQEAQSAQQAKGDVPVAPTIQTAATRQTDELNSQAEFIARAFITGTISDAEIEVILNSEELTSLFERETGYELEGTSEDKAEQIKAAVDAIHHDFEEDGKIAEENRAAVESEKNAAEESGLTGDMASSSEANRPSEKQTVDSIIDNWAEKAAAPTGENENDNSSKSPNALADVVIEKTASKEAVQPKQAATTKQEESAPEKTSSTEIKESADEPPKKKIDKNFKPNPGGTEVYVRKFNPFNGYDPATWEPNIASEVKRFVKGLEEKGFPEEAITEGKNILLEIKSFKHNDAFNSYEASGFGYYHKDFLTKFFFPDLLSNAGTTFYREIYAEYYYQYLRALSEYLNAPENSWIFGSADSKNGHSLGAALSGALKKTTKNVNIGKKSVDPVEALTGISSKDGGKNGRKDGEKLGARGESAGRDTKPQKPGRVESVVPEGVTGPNRGGEGSARSGDARIIEPGTKTEARRSGENSWQAASGLRGGVRTNGKSVKIGRGRRGKSLKGQSRLGHYFSDDSYEITEPNHYDREIISWISQYSDRNVRLFVGAATTKEKSISLGWYESNGDIWINASDFKAVSIAAHEVMHEMFDVSEKTEIDIVDRVFNAISDSIPDELITKFSFFMKDIKEFYIKEFKSNEIDSLRLSGWSEDDIKSEIAWREYNGEYNSRANEEIIVCFASANKETGERPALSDFAAIAQKSLIEYGVVPSDFFQTMPLPSNVEMAAFMELDRSNPEQETSADANLGANVRSMPKPEQSELNFTEYKKPKSSNEYKAQAEAKAKAETEAKAENAKTDAGKNVKEMEPPTAGEVKTTIAEKNFGESLSEAQDIAKKISGRVNEMSSSLKEKNREDLTAAEKRELNAAKKLDGLVQQINSVVSGELEFSSLKSYYEKLQFSPSPSSKRLYFSDVAEKISLANALLYDDNEGAHNRGTRAAYEAIAMLNKRIEQRYQADYLTYDIMRNINEKTNLLKESAVYKWFLKGGKKSEKSLTQDLIAPRLMFKMLDGCAAHNKAEGYKLAEEEMSCNVKNKEYEFEANNCFNKFYESEGAVDFLSGKTMSGVTVKSSEGKIYELSAIELLNFVRGHDSAMTTRETGADSELSSILIIRDGKKVSVPIYSDKDGVKLGGKTLENINLSFGTLMSENEAVLLYDEALTELFRYFAPKMASAFRARNGYDLVLLWDSYFPVRYASERTQELQEEMSFFDSLGAVKERTKESGGMLYVESSGAPIERYIQNASRYCAWAEFSQKIKMMSEPDAEGDSLISIFKNTYGEGMADQFKNYADYIQFKTSSGGKTRLESAAQILRKNLGTAAITLKISTPLKQCAGTLAAGGEINMKYLLAAQFGGGKKYSGADNKLLQHRALGAIDPTIENININGDIWWQKAVSKIPGGKAWLKAVPAADKAAIRNIYKAAAMQIAAENGVKDISDPKIKAEVDALFARALLGTQSDATTASNSRLYRSDNEFVKNLTLFTAQSNAQLNATLTAAMEAASAKNAAKISPKYAADYKAAAKRRNAVYAAQVASSIEFALLGQLVKFALHKFKRDEEEQTILTFLSDLGDSTLETLTGIHFLGDTAYSFVKYGIQLLSGKRTDTLYDISTGGLSTITDLIEKLNRFGQNVTLKNAKDLALSFSNLAGIPMSGAYDLVNAIALWSRDAYRAISGDEFDGDKYSDVLMFLQNKLDAEKRATGLGFDERIIYNASKEREASYDAMRALAEATGNMSFLPSEPNSGLTIDGTDYKLTEKQKDKFHDTQVNAYYGIMDELINKAIYKKSDAETQAAMAEAAKEYAYDIAKAEYAKDAHIEYESKYETLREGIDVPGVDDEGNPKPDIPGLSEKEIQKYLVYKAAYNKETADKDYKALDALLSQYGTSLTSKAQQHFERENSSVIEAYEAGVGTRSYYTYLEEKKKQANKLDVTTGSSDAIFHGLVNASIPKSTKDILADLVIESPNIKAMYHAASDNDYDVKALPDLWKEILASDPNPEVSDTSLSGGDLAYACRNNPGLEYIFKAIYEANKWSPDNPYGWKKTWEQIKKLK